MLFLGKRQQTIDLSSYIPVLFSYYSENYLKMLFIWSLGKKPTGSLKHQSADVQSWLSYKAFCIEFLHSYCVCLVHVNSILHKLF